MHSALFVACYAIAEETWRNFLTKAKVGIRKFPNVSRLSENVWLVNLQENPASLAYLVSAADAVGVSYGILPFQDEPEWLPSGLIPTPFRAKM